VHSQAKLAGLEDDLGLVGNQFNVAVSILNVGYILMQLPSNMILTRVRPSRYLPLFVCLWSVVSGCTAAADNYTHLVVIRFFLGIVEAPFFPGVFYLLSCWYTRKELALRTAVLYSGLILATAFSGLIAAGVFAQLEGAHGLAAWRWLFLIEGALSFGFGLLALLLLPDFPGKRKGSGRWLFTEEEREVSVQRIERDRVSATEADRSVWYGLKLTIADYRTWVFVSHQINLMVDSSNMRRITGFDADSQSHGLWFQLFLSYHRRRIWSRVPDDNTGLYSSTILVGDSCGAMCRLLKRSLRRSGLAHSWSNVSRYRRLHHHGRYHQHPRKILRILLVYQWLFLCKCRSVQLGIKLTRPDTREKGCLRCSDQSAFATWQHLESILLPR
jgi:MFS family permease